MHTEWRKEWGPTEILESSHYSAVREDPYQDLLAMDIQRGRDQGESLAGPTLALGDSGLHSRIRCVTFNSFWYFPISLEKLFWERGCSYRIIVTT